MRQFIKEHPWRLEIVPFILTVLAIIVPLIYRSERLAWFDSWANHKIIGTWLFTFAINVWIALVYMKRIINYNHDWVSAERYKRFNPNTIVLTGFMAATIWVFGFVILADLLYTWPLIPLAVIAESLLEYSRKYIPHEHAVDCEASGHMHNVQPGEKFYYREFNGLSLQKVLVLIPLIMLIYWLLFRESFAFVLAIIIGLAAYATSIKTFVISNDTITVGFWKMRVRIKIDDVLSCNISQSGLASPQKRRQANLAGDPYNRPVLRIEMKNGDEYLLGPKDPETACKLINTALAARGEKESEG